MSIRGHAWLVVGLLWVVALLNYLDRQVIFSVFPLVRAELRLSSVQLGLLSTAFLWMYAFVSPLGGYLADRYGRRRIILLSLAVWSLVTFATGRARDFEELVVARALMGVSEACYLPAALALIADYHGKSSRSFATGLHQSGLYVGLILGGGGGGWLGERYGWRPAFTILGFIGIVYAAVLVVGLREAQGWRATAETAGFAGRVKELVKLPGFVIMMFAMSMAAMSYWVVYTWLPLYLHERFHMSLTAAGFAATFYVQAASFGGVVLGGLLADRWKRSHVGGRLFTIVIGLIAAGPSLFAVGRANSFVLLFIGLLAFGLGRGFNDANVMPVLCQITRTQLRATGYGMLNCGACIVGGVMVAVAGAVKDSLGLGVAIQVSAVLLFLSGLTLLRMRPHLEPDS
jgi:MFS transporter, Spinster family, sphingosine-1-phosphate transporter